VPDPSLTDQIFGINVLKDSPSGPVVFTQGGLLITNPPITVSGLLSNTDYYVQVLDSHSGVVTPYEWGNTYRTGNCLPPNSPPTADAGSPHPLTVNSTHAHSGASAADIDGNLASYTWSFSACPSVCPPLSGSVTGSLSGGSQSVPGPTFIPNFPGAYTLLLTVRDALNALGQASVSETATDVVTASCQVWVQTPSGTNSGYAGDSATAYWSSTGFSVPTNTYSCSQTPLGNGSLNSTASGNLPITYPSLSQNCTLTMQEGARQATCSAALTVIPAGGGGTAPPNLSAGTTCNGASPANNLPWSYTAPAGKTASTYRIYRCQGSGCNPASQYASDGASPYLDTGVSAGTVYNYKIVAVHNDATESLDSNIVQVTTNSAAACNTPPPPSEPVYMNSAKFVSWAIPTTMNSSETRAVSVTMKNCWGYRAYASGIYYTEPNCGNALGLDGNYNTFTAILKNWVIDQWNETIPPITATDFVPGTSGQHIAASGGNVYKNFGTWVCITYPKCPFNAPSGAIEAMNQSANYVLAGGRVWRLDWFEDPECAMGSCDAWGWTPITSGNAGGKSLWVVSNTEIYPIVDNLVSRWDGSQWIALTPSDSQNQVRYFRFVSPTEIYALKLSDNNVWRWNGSAWTQITSGFNVTQFSLIRLASGGFDASKIYAMGSGTINGQTVASNGLAVWSGGQWQTLSPVSLSTPKIEAMGDWFGNISIIGNGPGNLTGSQTLGAFAPYQLTVTGGNPAGWGLPQGKVPLPTSPIVKNIDAFFSFNITAPAAAGCYPFQASMGFEDVTPSVQICVGIAPPNLTATQPVPSIASPELGGTISFTGSVSNAPGGGDAITRFYNWFFVDIGDDNVGAGGVPGTSPLQRYDVVLYPTNPSWVNWMGASGSQTVISPDWTNIPEGTHRVYLCADINNQITELNENDNCANAQITVSGVVVASAADLIISSGPSLNSGILQTGQTIDFRGTVTNQGKRAGGGDIPEWVPTGYK